MQFARFFGTVAFLAALAACSKHEPPKKERPVQPPSAAAKNDAASWSESSSTDAMTDVTTYFLSTSDKRTNGGFSFMCDPEQESAFFTSPLFLDSGSQGTIKIRFDGDKAEDEAAFLSKTVALLRDPKEHGSPKSEPIEKFLMEISAHVFLLELRAHPHRRLRARLKSFDGQTTDLEFDISGLQPKLAQLERRCDVKP